MGHSPAVTRVYPGWHQVAFAQELSGAVTPCAIADRQLVLVRRAGGIEAFDAVCPHRGAHLGYGGVVDGDELICPFHGHRIRLGAAAESGYCVRAYRTVSAAGSAFVLF